MINYSRLLVVIDPEEDTQPALARACLLANATHAKITAVMCIYDFSYEMTTMLSIDERDAMRSAVINERTEWLSKIIIPYQNQLAADNKINFEVIWDNKTFEAVIKAGIACHSDLIIKSTKSHDGLASLIFTPTDWHLLRKSPFPVLLVKSHDWPSNGNIVAAVNVGTEDKQHADLNHKITTIAKDYAELLNAEVHLANSFPGTPMNIAIEIPEFDPAGYTASVESHHKKEMKKFATLNSIDEGCCVVKQGLPEAAIPTIAQQLDAELVVIGTVGRVGISAALIGNTAEHVIDALNCDVLAIKPDGFISPIH